MLIFAAINMHNFDTIIILINMPVASINQET